MPARSEREFVRGGREARSNVQKTIRPAHSPFALKDSTEGDRGLSHDQRQEMQILPASDTVAIPNGRVFAMGSVGRRFPG